MTAPSKSDTKLAHLGSKPAENFGILNPPVYRASTVLFPTLAALEEAAKDPFKGVYYGRHGTPTTFAFEDAIAALEGGYRTTALPSGVAAIAAALMAFVKAGDHILMVDTVYNPIRRFCDTVMARFGVETAYYDPLVGGGIAALIRPNTKVVFTESPGSLTFEVQDIPAIVAVAHKAGAVVVMDNTWATPLYFQPFAHGVDVSIQSVTKYVGGHADLMLGTITSTEPHWRKLRRSAADFGACAAPDVCSLALRGLRTLSVRLSRHRETGLILAGWLAKRPEVARLLHPALPDDPGHALWKRDFTGASGLFGVVLKEVPRKALAAMLDGMELFGMGFSWGGFESLILPVDPRPYRTATTWKAPGPLLRIHAGLEDPDDLIRDLERGFDRLARSV